MGECEQQNKEYKVVINVRECYRNPFGNSKDTKTVQNVGKKRGRGRPCEKFEKKRETAKKAIANCEADIEYYQAA